MNVRFIWKTARSRLVHRLDHAAEILAGARRLVVLTGAGVSTESGVPDFRSDSGIWSRFDPSDFEYARFVHDPAGFWRLRAELMDVLDLDAVLPNAAHAALAQASRSARYAGHVTQNIDGLFSRAGHVGEKLVEVHGSAQTVRCIGCDACFPYDRARLDVEAGRIPPPCPDCGGPLKPGTVLFGETLPAMALEQGTQWMRGADVVLVVGSSLVVYPVAALPRVALERGARLVIVNAETTGYDVEAHAVVRGKAGSVVPELLQRADLLPPP